jgi:uncharacterized protein (DUF488 family)
MSIQLFTIGFTKKSAEQFFTRIKNAGVKRVLDIRLKRDSQLAGFAKERDLRYFLPTICSIDYKIVPELAPTDALLTAYKKEGAKWDFYEREFNRLLEQRRVEEKLDKSMFDFGCLLCSESTAEQCHRRLVAEYLQRRWGDVEIKHL